jgi:hypothetical protein
MRRVTDTPPSGEKIAVHTLLAGAVCLPSAGLLLPESPFELAAAAIALALFLGGALLVILLGGRHRWAMLNTFSLFVIVASAAFLAAGIAGKPFGTFDAAWVLERKWERDDIRLFEEYIVPSLSSNPVSPIGGPTNAPLFWAFNVNLQWASRELGGAIAPALGGLSNIITGALAAAFVVGAIAMGSQTPAARDEAIATAKTLALTCPWLVVSSFIFIRDVWLYALFGFALFAGVWQGNGSPIRKWLWHLGIGATVYGLCLMLRPEMAVLCASLVFVADALVTVDTDSIRLRQALLVAAALLALANASEAIQEKVLQPMKERAETYGDNAASQGDFEGNTDRGTVSSLIGQSLAARSFVQTLWLPLQPLPKVQLRIGSAYSLGKILMPIWTVACALALLLSRKAYLLEGKNRSRPKGPFEPRLVWAAGWIAVVALAVGSTSAETRHFYIVIPLFIWVVSISGATYGGGWLNFQKKYRSGWKLALLMLTLSALWTAIAFGFESVISYQ